MVWPLAAPFSVVVLPVVALVLAAGYVKILLSALLPSAALIVAVPLSVATQTLVALVEALDTLPGSSVRVGHAPAAWSLAALAWVVAWAATRGRLWGFWGSGRARRLVRW